MAKTQTKKDLQEAMNKEAEAGLENIAEIAADISLSPIDDTDKAVFLYSIAQGTFNLNLFEKYQELLKNYKEGLLEEAKRVEAQLDILDQQLKDTQGELAESSVGAMKEIKAACEHIEVSTIKEIEHRGEEKAAKEVANIRKDLKNEK